MNCNQCHAAGYANTPNTCEACHLTDYNATTDPNHVTAGFPTDCAMCHDEGSWGNATFDHNTTSFPLTGMHVNVNCIECHAAGYTNTPTNCDACHMTDYTGTVEPNHTQANFSTDCTQCHTADGWTPSSFDHRRRQACPDGSPERELQPVPRAGYANTPNTCEACHPDGLQRHHRSEPRDGGLPHGLRDVPR
ncbi:MAG: hypothetical protein IPL52_14175 [Flavobacteriales bacterium]|nr:hypothetical protein [Flavobacteriales bacterium]